MNTLLPALFSSLAFLAVVAIFRLQTHLQALNSTIEYANRYIVDTLRDLDREYLSYYIGPYDAHMELMGSISYLHLNSSELLEKIDKTVSEINRVTKEVRDSTGQQTPSFLLIKRDNLGIEKQRITLMRQETDTIAKYFNVPLYINFFFIFLTILNLLNIISIPYITGCQFFGIAINAFASFRLFNRPSELKLPKHYQGS